MTLYLSIIFFGATIIAFCNGLFAQEYLHTSSLGIIFYTWLAVVISFLIDATCAFLIRQIPEEKFNDKNWFFKERRGERHIYENLKIRKWKEIIPELGGLLKYFDKSRIEANPDSKYMKKFITETCYGEVMHAVSIVFAPLVLFIMPSRFLLTMTLPVLVVNIFLQIPPIMVQRYTRPKLEVVLKRLKMTEERTKLSV
jgi:glycosyl-4,4'-diaponeurosporenoate acyltransferase